MLKGDKSKLKLRYLADQDPNWVPFVASEDARDSVRPGTNIPDQRVRGYSRRTRLDGTVYTTWTDESTSFMSLGRRDTVIGFDATADGEVITLEDLAEQRERDQDAFNRLNAINNPQPQRLAPPVQKTAPEQPPTPPSIDAILSLLTDEQKLQLAAMLGAAKPEPKAPGKRAKTPVEAPTGDPGEIDQLPF